MSRKDEFLDALHDLRVDAAGNLLEDLVDEAEIALHVSKGPKPAAPVLITTPAIQYKTKKGSTKVARKTSLFTRTSKMRAPSFGLPSGPPREGINGACPASMLGGSDDSFLCYGCYAYGGNYIYPSNQISQQVRYAMVRAIRSFCSVPRYANDLHWGDEKHKAKVELDLSYFRIHDSGDFFSPRYYSAWCEVCAQLPQISFWAPTRLWAGRPGPTRQLSTFMEELSRIKRPRNLVLRPSALHFADKPPVLTGFNAGSCSTENPAASIFDCPAYAIGTEKKAKKKAKSARTNPELQTPGTSCYTAGCRVCWDRRDRPVNYHPHGVTAMKGVRALAGKNPGGAPKLGHFFDEWAIAAKRNPPSEPGGGESFFAAVAGMRGVHWTEDEWFDLLGQHGFSDDEAHDYLADHAEWFIDS
jgi:hypothetical protein